MTEQRDIVNELHQEKKELDGKINRLRAFLECDGNKKTFAISQSQWDLMGSQKSSMIEYSSILQKRIEDLGG